MQKKEKMSANPPTPVVEIQEKKNSNILLIVVAVLGFTGCLTAIFMPLMLTQWSWGAELGVLKPNEIGDTIGGTMGPIVGLIGAILTFFAFYIQIKANNDQRKQFRQSLLQQEKALKEQTKQFKITLKQQENASINQKLQTEDQLNIAKKQVEDAQKQFVYQDIATRRERFANRYYMMITVHRDNVAAFDIDGINGKHIGRRAFPSIFNELRFLYWTTINFYKIWLEKPKKTSLTEEELFQISYLTFFFGFGQTSSPMVSDLVGVNLSSFTQDLHKHFEIVKKNKLFEINTLHGKLKYEEQDIGTGHLHRLSHYFRHIYQTVKYVNDQQDDLLKYEKKYNYLSNLRAQLSVHEQLLLYYNALSVLGKPWMELNGKQKEGLLSHYCMVRSIPLNTADFYLKPEKILGESNKMGKPMFEWVEIKQRMSKLAPNPLPKS